MSTMTSARGLKLGGVESNIVCQLRLRAKGKPDKRKKKGGSQVRRIPFVPRASNSGEPRREHKNGLGVRRDDATRLQWQWHDYQGPVPKWNRTNPSDRDFGLSSSELWDCYNVTSQPPNGSYDEGDTVNNTMTPEQEFISYAKKVPMSQLTGIDLIKCGAENGFSGSEEVYVLLFGVGEETTEGIYSLRSHCHESGMHHETIICFESSEDAARFSGLLEASMPHVSTVHTIKSSELIQFCCNSGYDCRLELEGSTLMPPEFNVGITDWERSMKLRQGHYQVLESEPDLSMKEEDSDLSDGIDSQLDEVRAMLERLLPEN